MHKRQFRKKRRQVGGKSSSRRQNQIGGFLPGLLGHLIGNAIRKRQRKKPVKFSAKRYMTNAIGRRVQVAKQAAQRKLPTPGSTGMNVKTFLNSGLFGIG